MGTIQAQIVGHPGHRDPGKLTRELISYRFSAAMSVVCRRPARSAMERTIVARRADFSIGMPSSEDNNMHPDGSWRSRIRVLEHSVCREFTPMLRDI
jgi:hypothetical protein